MNSFVNESKDVTTDGILIDGKLIKCNIEGIICDTPAKSFILGTKGHSGYSSCTRCTQVGSYIEGRVTFPNLNDPPRTHESFVNKEDEDFHMSNTSLTEIPGLNMVRSFPLDYMHAVCLGVMRTLILTWIFSPPHPSKFPARLINQLSSNLLSLQVHFPIEFNRKPRSVSEIKRWKATELRSFLLYTGPVVLKSIFSQMNNGTALYNHFLSLSIAMTILLNPVLSLQYLDYAKGLLIHFVQCTKILYGPQFLTSNFHSLIHITDDVAVFGHLDNCSAFPYENYLQTMKKYVRKGQQPLQQVVKRLSEDLECNIFAKKLFKSNTEPSYSGEHFNGPLISHNANTVQYRKVKFTDFTLSISQPNSCCALLDGTIIKIKNIIFSTDLNCMVLLYNPYRKKEPYFKEPFSNSSFFGIFTVGELSSELLSAPITSVKHKIILLPSNSSSFVAFPLIHSF